jgi:hypothetical protein
LYTYILKIEVDKTFVSFLLTLREFDHFFRMFRMLLLFMNTEFWNFIHSLNSGDFYSLFLNCTENCNLWKKCTGQNNLCLIFSTTFLTNVHIFIWYSTSYALGAGINVHRSAQEVCVILVLSYSNCEQTDKL